MNSRRTTYYLHRTAPAIQVISEADGHLRMGTMLRLPEGAELQVCGDGFDNHTVKVAWEGGYYYVFLQDVEELRYHAAATA